MPLKLIAACFTEEFKPVFFTQSESAQKVNTILKSLSKSLEEIQIQKKLSSIGDKSWYWEEQAAPKWNTYAFFLLNIAMPGWVFMVTKKKKLSQAKVVSSIQRKIVFIKIFCTQRFILFPFLKGACIERKIRNERLGSCVKDIARSETTNLTKRSNVEAQQTNRAVQQSEQKPWTNQMLEVILVAMTVMKLVYEI